MQSIIIKSNTYHLRHDIRSIGGVFDYEHKKHRLPYTGRNEQRCKDKGLEIDIIEDGIIIDEKYEVLQKNIRAKNKSEKRKNVSVGANSKAKKYELNSMERGFLQLMEPVKVGHHSEKRHRKLLDKAWNNMGKQVECWDKADEANRKCKYWENKKYLTTEEKKVKKQKVKETIEIAIQMWKNEHPIGSDYLGLCKPFPIAKINKVTVKLESGSVCQIRYATDFNKYLLQAKEIIEIL